MATTDRKPYSRSEESKERERRMRALAPDVLAQAGFTSVAPYRSHAMHLIRARDPSGASIVAWVKCAWPPGKSGHCAVQLDFPADKPRDDAEAVQRVADKAMRAASYGATHLLLFAADQLGTTPLAALLLPIGEIGHTLQAAVDIDRKLARNGHSPSLYIVTPEHGLRRQIVDLVRSRSLDLLSGGQRNDTIDDLDARQQDGSLPDRVSTAGTRFRRDDRLRRQVIARAGGQCELCGAPGFPTPSGERYLEAHHIISLASQGQDALSNLIALCASHHREAHYGKDAEVLEGQMIDKLHKLGLR